MNTSSFSFSFLRLSITITDINIHCHPSVVNSYSTRKEEFPFTASSFLDYFFSRFVYRPLRPLTPAGAAAPAGTTAAHTTPKAAAEAT